MRRMWTRAGALCVLALGTSGLTAGGAAAQGQGQEDFSKRVLASGFENPWEVTYGPDGKLWVSEQDAGRVSRVDPESGRKTTLLRVRDLYLTDDPAAQDGMVGLALSPRVGKAAKGHVYVAYAYDADPDPDQLLRRMKIRRYTYARGARRLTEPKNLITGMPASNDHNSGRLVLGPDRKLYYTIGDQGNNQFDNVCTPIRSQDLPTAKQVADRDWQTYQGKVLRLNTDGSIPADNPTFGGVRSHVFSYGHRNAQGIVFGRGGLLYSVEHGPKSDDELNIVRAGGNYGWPHVLGYQDDQAYTYDNWSRSVGVPCPGLTYDNYVIPPSVPRQEESEWSSPDFVEPIRTFFTVPSDHPFDDPRCGDTPFVCWPTIGPSSVDIYTAGAVPGWANSLLITTLKHGTVYRLKLSADGRSTVGNLVPYWTTVNRYRDIALDPDGRTFYVATDQRGFARGSDGLPTRTLENRGVILRFRYRGG